MVGWLGYSMTYTEHSCSRIFLYAFQVDCKNFACETNEWSSRELICEEILVLRKPRDVRRNR